jgi:hypothetical protein
MARKRRRRRTAPKLSKRPIADALLGPLAELPLAPDLADEIEMMWAALGPVGHRRFAAGARDADDERDADDGAHASMLAKARRAADRVREHARRSDFRARLLRSMGRSRADADDFADQYASDLAALVRCDPRYLASDLVIGTVLLWKLVVIRGLQHARRGTKRVVVAERARKYLDDLADAARALAVVTGRGRQEFIDPIVLLADHERHVDVVRDVIELINSDKSDAEIVIEMTKRDKRDEITSVTKLSLASVAAIRERPRAVKQHAEQLTLDLYGLSFQADRLGRLLRDARDALDPQPPGWPRPRRAPR